MFLKTLVLLNWGNLPHGEFAMGPVNLFSGANGSGKTTAADSRGLTISDDATETDAPPAPPAHISAKRFFLIHK